MKLYFIFLKQNCVQVLESLCRGDFGPCEKTIQDYQARCHALLPHATAFIVPAPKACSEGVLTNGSLS